MARDDLGLDSASADRSWVRALEILRESGQDPDEILVSAGEALRRWQEMPRAEREKAIREETEEWAAWEQTVDDMGTPR